MVLALLLLQLPAVQTFVAKRVLASLEEKFDGKLTVGGIQIEPFNTIIINDALLLDNAPVAGQDTVFCARNVTAKFSLRDLIAKDKPLSIKSVSISDGMFALITDADKVANITRVFRLDPNQEQEKLALELNVGKININNFRYKMLSLDPDQPEYSGHGINWSDLDLVTTLSAKDLKIEDGIITGTLDHLTVDEKCGYSIEDLSASAKVGKGLAEVTDIKMKDRWSNISIPRFSMTAPIADYSDFVNKVRMDFEMDRSTVDMQTISQFGGATLDKPVSLDIASANGFGTVNNLTVNRIDFREKGGLSARASARLGDLTGPEGLYLNFDVKDMAFSVPQIQELLGKVLGPDTPNLSKFGGGKTFRLDAKGSGTLARLLADVNLRSSDGGTLDASCTLSGLDGSAPMKIGALLDTRDFDVGGILGIDQVRQVSLHTYADATFKKGESIPQVTLDTLMVSRLNALGYDYTGIAAAGELVDNAFNGKIACSDPNLHFIFQGLLSLSPQDQNAIYKFYLNLGYADLNALNIDKRGTSKVSLAMDANYMRIPQGDLIGTAGVSGVYLENDKGGYDIGDISISSHTSNDLYRISLNSDFADASYISNRSILQFPKALMNISALKALPVLFQGKEPVPDWQGDEYKVDVDIYDCFDLLSFVMPGLYIAEGTTIDLNIDKEGIMDAAIKSQRLAFENNYIKDVDLDLNNRDGLIAGQLTGNEARAAGIALRNTSLIFGVADDNIDARFSYHNPDLLMTGADISLIGDLSRAEDGTLVIDASTQPSIISGNGTEWRISPSKINFNNGNLSIGNLLASAQDQSITIDGGISKTYADTLTLDMKQFDLGVLSQVLDGMIDIGGRATGQAVLTSPLGEDMGLLMNIVCDSATINHQPLGELMLASNWNDETSSIDAQLVSNLDGGHPIQVTGSYSPKNKTVDASAELDGFDLAYFDGIAPDVFSEMGGKVHGLFHVGGPLDNLSISGEDTFLNGVMLRVAMTNVPYYLSGPFQVSDTGITFNNVTLRDGGNGTGRVRGGVNFDHLKDWRMNMRFIVDNIQAFNTTYTEALPIYGQLYASGNISITGPFDHLTLGVDATTERNGRFHISLGNTSGDTNANLLVFKEVEKDVWTDPYERFYSNYQTAQKEATQSSFDVRLNVNVTPQTELMLELDKEGTSSITCSGQGSTAIDIRNNVFSINGDYTINSGLCHLGLLGVATRDFDIKDGSSIKFNGDVMDSDLDINAVYTTKASLSGLIADTTSVGSRRTVECTLNIYDKLRNPQLGFAIDIPDIDPITRASVESALNTEDKIQKQFVALLVGNSFIPDEQSGIVNTSSMLYSNVAGIMASQLSNILQRLNIPLDLGLKYQPNEGGTDIFDVAISTELFNNRVVVNGAIGNRMYGSKSNSDVVGDLDIEVKLDRSGAWRLTLFSHSVDQYTNYLDDSQRNGVGMAYQKEFNTFQELWKAIFTRKKKGTEEEFVVEEVPKTTFSIE